MTTIRVRPTKPDYATLQHPTAGAIGTGADWPADQFTFRRIGEGAIERVEQSETAADPASRKGGK
ncbi:MAG: hypothetical protein AB7U62_04350 [Pseudolabrys sp.]